MRRSRSSLPILILTVLLSLFMSGCIQLEMLLKVKKDGSGTFTETVLFDVGLLEDFLKRLPAAAQGTSRPWDIDENQLKAQAIKKGKGVTYVSAEPLARGRFKGYTANYTFTDVTAVAIDPDPGKRAPSGPQPEEQRSDPMRFGFKKGRTAELTVKVPHEDNKKGKKAAPKKIDPSDENFEMMRGFLKDMKVLIQVEVDGKVEKTNAKFRDGNRITLIALDFNTLIDDATRLAAVINADSYDETAKAFNAVPGMKMETQKQVRVSFK